MKTIINRRVYLGMPVQAYSIRFPSGPLSSHEFYVVNSSIEWSRRGRVGAEWGRWGIGRGIGVSSNNDSEVECTWGL